MNIAVTGGTGFIGRNLIERHLHAGDSVRVLSRRGLSNSAAILGARVFTADLTHSTPLPREFTEGVDVLYHCASELKVNGQMRPLHVDGTHRLIEAAAGRIGRWVQLSSAGVYGGRMFGTVDENTSPQPDGDYERTKLEADALVVEAGRNGAFDFTLLRPTIVFGPEMRNQSLYGLIGALARRRFFFIGPEGASANYIYVDNVVEALVRSAVDSRAAGQIYNLSDWRTMEEFVGQICRLLGRSPPRLRLPFAPLRGVAKLLGLCPGSPLTERRVLALNTRARYPIDKIRRELKYDHIVTMEQGLERIVDRQCLNRQPRNSA